MAGYVTAPHPKSDDVPESGLWQTDPELRRLFNAYAALPDSQARGTPAYIAKMNAAQAVARYTQANRQRLGIPDNYSLDPRTGGMTLYDPNNNQLRDAGITAAIGVGAGFGAPALASAFGGAPTATVPGVTAPAAGSASAGTGLAASTPYILGETATAGGLGTGATLATAAGAGAGAGLATNALLDDSVDQAGLDEPANDPNSKPGTKGPATTPPVLNPWEAMLKKFLDPGNLVNTGLNVAAGYFGSQAAKEAAEIQAQSAREALALQREIYNRNQANMAPWLGTGGGAIMTLGRLMGSGYLTPGGAAPPGGGDPNAPTAIPRPPGSVPTPGGPQGPPAPPGPNVPPQNRIPPEARRYMTLKGVFAQ